MRVGYFISSAHIKSIIIFINLLLINSFVVCQQEVLENKAAYENFLAGKLENTLIKILGPNQVKVLVDVTMDYSKIEKVEYEKDKEEKKSVKFALEKEAGDVSGIEYLMPGFQMPTIPSSSQENFLKSYTKQLFIPSNLIKKIKVSLIVNEKVDNQIISNLTNITKEILSLDEKRGDEVIVIKSFFAPIWKTIWYDPQSVNFIIKYIILSLVGIISLLIVAMGFLKLATAMNTMAKVQQTHQITMEVAGGQGSGGSLSGIISDIPRPQGLIDSSRNNKVEEENENTDKIYFNIKPYQLDALINLMIKEDPSNVAIVVDHLKDDIKKEFISRLPEDFAAEVVKGLSQIRFIDKDTIMTLKEELETRLEGVTGGVKNTIELLSQMSWIEKSKIVKNIEEKYPELYIELKKHILLFEDLKFFEPNELSIIISTINIEDWINVYGIMDESLKDKMKSEFSQTTLKIIEEKSKGDIPKVNIEKSITSIMNSVEKLISEGRIKKPELKVSGFINKE
ncbi:MAG: hypothetical protein N2Z20_04335 [Elusimicrobiales bacterium]|nr:hypothetical protein [Elusimicrobiales bacterium]